MMKLTFITFYDKKFPYPSLMLLQLSCDFACLELAFVALFTFYICEHGMLFVTMRSLCCCP